jgi:hypothetical protein
VWTGPACILTLFISLVLVHSHTHTHTHTLSLSLSLSLSLRIPKTHARTHARTHSLLGNLDLDGCCSDETQSINSHSFYLVALEGLIFRFEDATIVRDRLSMNSRERERPLKGREKRGVVVIVVAIVFLTVLVVVMVIVVVAVVVVVVVSHLSCRLIESDWADFEGFFHGGKCRAAFDQRHDVEKPPLEDTIWYIGASSSETTPVQESIRGTRHKRLLTHFRLVPSRHSV